MIWEELSLDRVVNDPALAGAFGELFHVAPDAVRIVDTIEDAPRLSDTATRLVIERWVVGGEFPLQVTVYPRDITTPDDSLAAVQRLCARLDCSCLLSDDSPSPLTWLRVQPDGTVEHVTVEADALDRDEFVIAGVHPSDRQTDVA